MNLAISVNQKQLMEGLLDVAPVRSVFIWGAPGIGKSSIVEQFAAAVGLPCVSLFGSQLVPEDIIGVPRIVEGRSEFCPPRSIARDEPYCLFLDELNACSQEVQKAFYSLILERRVGEYRMPEEPIVVAAGNRAQDSAITRPMSSALLNRMIHVELTSDSRVWLEWAAGHGIRPYVYDYICARPDQLWSQPPKTEEPFSTPRSCLMLSDALNRGLLQEGNRRQGTVPAGLVEEIHALARPPIRWDVERVRVVFCDVVPYDQGFMDPADIAWAVQVRGRGGTRLQFGIDLLEDAGDFPKDAPLLIIADGFCERLNLRGREHAYLIPWGNHLPFPPRGPVFKLR